LYQRRRGGKVALTEEAYKYREHVKKVVASNLSSLSNFPLDRETVYSMDIKLYFELLENPGWFDVYTRGANVGKRKAENRYKVVDYDNRIKFIQDSVVNAVGIPNDCQIFMGTQEKHEDSECPRAEILIKPIPKEKFFKEGKTWPNNQTP
jgi:Holliday junction resolvase RusA-like endonuclease